MKDRVVKNVPNQETNIGKIKNTMKQYSNHETESDNHDPEKDEKENSPVKDKQSLLKNKNQETASRARKMNRVAKRLLDKEIGLLELHYLRNYKQLKKEMQLAENELKKINLEKTGMPEPLPNIQPGTVSHNVPCPVEITQIAADDRKVDQQCACRFGVTNSSGPCKMFPCYLPYSYHSIRFQVHPKQYSILSNYEDLAHHSLSIRPPSACFASEEYRADNMLSAWRKPLRSTVKEREMGLQKILTEMRAKNRMAKPKDWAINYGAPITRRIFSKPAIAVSMISS